MNTRDVVAIGISTLIVGVMLGYAWAYHVYTGDNYISEYADNVHTMRVYEDGSYVVDYKIGGEEVGCLRGGLCND